MALCPSGPTFCSNPAFRDDDVRRVSDNTLSALALRKDHPPAVASQVFARALWGDDHPFAWPDAGTPTSLPTLTPADVSHFHSAYYAPNNAVLVVSGDITAAQIRHQIEPLLAGWKAKRIPPIRLPRVAAPEKQSIVLVDKAGAPQSSVRIGLPAIERRDPDYYRALVANQILGGTFRRLAMNLRETKGWTYGISSQLDARKLAGAWLVTSELVAGHTSDGVARDCQGDREAGQRRRHRQGARRGQERAHRRLSRPLRHARAAGRADGGTGGVRFAARRARQLPPRRSPRSTRPRCARWRASSSGRTICWSWWWAIGPAPSRPCAGLPKFHCATSRAPAASQVGDELSRATPGAAGGRKGNDLPPRGSGAGPVLPEPLSRGHVFAGVSDHLPRAQRPARGGSRARLLAR